MATDLTILCVTKLGAHAGRFLDDMGSLAAHIHAEFVVAVDGNHRFPDVACDISTRIDVQSNGSIESVLDQAVRACTSEYVLRLDDDERTSEALQAWLEAADYRDAEHWAFPRMHLWPDAEHFVTSAPLWPDLQTRCSIKAKAGGRARIHQGSPYGTGRVADVAIEHHKFLVRDLAEREALIEQYENLQPGAGSDHFARFSVPERFASELEVAAL